MGSGLSPEFEKLVDERKLIKARISRGMIPKEIEAAKADLRDARDSFEQRKYKWATIQGYYSLFHGSRALLYHRGFREKSHYALFVAIRELYSSELEPSMIDTFEEAMNLRQEADYGLIFSKDGAIETIKGAEALLLRVCELLK
jgi:uncharacterized protein (UPF0332 family)